MPDLYYYCSLILFLYYHSSLQFFFDSIFPKQRFSFCNLQDSHHLCIHKTWLTSNKPCIICRYYYLSRSLHHTLQSRFSRFISYCHENKTQKILLYIPQNTVLIEVVYFSKVNYLASYLDLNLCGTSAASTSPVHKPTRILLQIIGMKEIAAGLLGMTTTALQQ